MTGDEQNYEVISKMSLRELMELVETHPHYLADGYYRGYDKAICKRWEELCIVDEDREKNEAALQARVKVLEQELTKLQAANANLTYFIPERPSSMSSLEWDGWNACVDEIKFQQDEARKSGAISFTVIDEYDDCNLPKKIYQMPKEPCGLPGPIGPSHCGWCSTCTAPWEAPKGEDHPNPVVLALVEKQAAQSEGEFWSQLADDLGAKQVPKVTPNEAEPKKECVACEGWGSISTGIDHAPTTQCRACGGSGMK